MTLLCNKREIHKVEIWRFCFQCAQSDKNFPLHKVIFCKGCTPRIMDQHEKHSEKCVKLDNKAFLDKLNIFRQYIKEQLKDVLSCQSTRISVQTFQCFVTSLPVINILLDRQFTIQRHLCENEPLRAYLLKVKFWHINIPQKSQTFKKSCRAQLQSRPEIHAQVLNIKKQIEAERDAFKWSMSIDNSIDPQHWIIDAEQGLDLLRKQANIAELYLKMYEREANDETMAQLLSRSINGVCKPAFFLLTLAKMKMQQLQPDSKKKITQLLNEYKDIPTNQREKQLYHYYQAAKQWRQVDPREPNIRRPYFREQRNNKYYRIDDINAYMKNMIELTKIAKPKRPVYHAFLALGYIQIRDYDKAREQFETASKLGYRSDCFDSNWDYINDNGELMNDCDASKLKHRSVNYLINAAKSYKKAGKHKDLLQCIELLLQRQPTNVSYKIQQIKAMIQVDVEYYDTAITQTLEQLMRSGKISRDQFEDLNRKKCRQQAKLEQDSGYYQNVQRKLQFVSQNGRPSPTDYYNLAVFQYRMESWKQALENVNKALLLREKQCYYKLKFFTLFMLQDFDAAKEIEHLVGPLANLEPMVEHLKNI